MQTAIAGLSNPYDANLIDPPPHTHNSICSIPLESPVYIPTCTLKGTMANHMLSVCQILSPMTEEFRALFKC